MNAWQPQASYPCGNFSDTYSFEIKIYKGSLSQTFQYSDKTEQQSQIIFFT